MPNQYLERYAARLRIEAAYHYHYGAQSPFLQVGDVSATAKRFSWYL